MTSRKALARLRLPLRRKKALAKMKKDGDFAKPKNSLSGVPDGTKMPFAAGELADALAIEAVSSRELHSYADLDGKEFMLA